MDNPMPKLGDAAERLNKSFDAISERIRGIEHQLANEFKLGTTATVWLSVDTFGLTYQRFNRDWRILVILDAEPDGSIKDWKPWMDCNRDVKLATVPLIPLLLEELAATALEQAKQAEAALAALPEANDFPF